MRPRRSARTTASVRFCVPSLPSRARTWNRTVCSLMRRRAAISLFARPSATSDNTSASRSLSGSATGGGDSPGFTGITPPHDGWIAIRPSAIARAAATTIFGDAPRGTAPCAPAASASAAASPSASSASTGSARSSAARRASASAGSRPRSQTTASAAAASSTAARSSSAGVCPTTRHPGSALKSAARPARASRSSATTTVRSVPVAVTTPPRSPQRPGRQTRFPALRRAVTPRDRSVTEAPERTVVGDTLPCRRQPCGRASRGRRRRAVPGGHDPAHRQRRRPYGAGGARHAAPVRAARRPGAAGAQIRLRPGAVRRVHRAPRRRGRPLVHDPGRRGGGPADHHPRGAGAGRPAAPGAAGVCRRTGHAVRLLRERVDHDRGGADGPHAESERCRSAVGAGGADLPVRRAHAHAARGPPRRAVPRMREEGSMINPTLSRRRLLAAGGAVVVGFAMPALTGRGGEAAAAPGTGMPAPDALDSWLAIGPDGRVTVFTDKVDLGMGVSTAFAQIAADELDVPVQSVSIVMGDTARTPDQGGVGGSTSIAVGAVPVRQAAAEARRVLVGLAADRLGVAADTLAVRDGVVYAPDDPTKSASYGDLIGGRRFNIAVTGSAPVKAPDQYKIVGTSVPRIDIPAKAAGAFTYIVDVRVPGMLHGRVIRPPVPGARLVSAGSAEGLPGVHRIVAKGNFVGVVADTEWHAVQAAKTS